MAKLRIGFIPSFPSPRTLRFTQRRSLIIDMSMHLIAAWVQSLVRPYYSMLSHWKSDCQVISRLRYFRKAERTRSNVIGPSMAWNLRAIVPS